MSDGRLSRPLLKREIHLDFIRGVAILMVVDFHTTGLFQRAHIPFLSGALGVAMFFVLSGFLVGGILLREWDRHSGIDAKRFLVRRGLKIWPQYYVFLLVITGIAVGVITTELIEVPMLRVRDRVFPPRIPAALEVGVEETAQPKFA